MAGIAYVKKRLFNPELIIDPNGVLPNELKQTIRGYNIPTYFIKWTGTPQAGEELGTPAASAKDGSTTPFQLNVVSSDVADDRGTAAGAVHSVAAIGITVSAAEAAALDVSNPKSTVEVMAMDGTTDVFATRWWLWFDGLYACEWGTGATDATGNIDGESPPNTTLIRILATQNEGEGGRWHFVAGKKLKTRKIKLSMTAVAAAQDGLDLDGAFTGFDQTNNTDPDLNVDHYTIDSPGGNSKEWGESDLYRWTTKTSTCIWSETLIANAIASDIEIHQIIV